MATAAEIHHNGTTGTTNEECPLTPTLSLVQRRAEPGRYTKSSHSGFSAE
jgi:hypothetical protein